MFYAENLLLFSIKKIKSWVEPGDEATKPLPLEKLLMLKQPQTCLRTVDLACADVTDFIVLYDVNHPRKWVRQSRIQLKEVQVIKDALCGLSQR